MRNTFISRDQNFSARSNATWRNLFLVGSIGFFIIIVLAYSIVYHEGGRRRTKLARIREGLSHMDTETIAISGFVSILVITGVIVGLKAHYNNRKIIVEVGFDDTRKELSVKVKTVQGRESSEKYNYSDLKFEYNNLSDGMTPPMYQTLTLLHNDNVVGHIYRGHFTWEDSEFNEIRDRIKNA